MAVLSGLVVTLVLLALVCLPCVMVVLFVTDASGHLAIREVIRRVVVERRVVRRARLHWVERRLAYRAGLGRRLPRVHTRERTVPVGPPIEAGLRLRGEARPQQEQC